MMLFLMDSETVLTPRAQEFQLDTPPPKLANSYSEFLRGSPQCFLLLATLDFPLQSGYYFSPFKVVFSLLQSQHFVCFGSFPLRPTLFYYSYIHLNPSFFLSFTLLVIDSRPVAFEIVVPNNRFNRILGVCRFW